MYLACTILDILSFISQLLKQFLFVEKATAQKTEKSKCCVQTQCTEASYHIYASGWPVINVKARFWALKTRCPAVSCSTVCMILRLAVSADRPVTTGIWTDGHTMTAYTSHHTCIGLHMVKTSEHPTKLHIRDECITSPCAFASCGWKMNKPVGDLVRAPPLSNFRVLPFWN